MSYFAKSLFVVSPLTAIFIPPKYPPTAYWQARPFILLVFLSEKKKNLFFY